MQTAPTGMAGPCCETEDLSGEGYFFFRRVGVLVRFIGRFALARVVRFFARAMMVSPLRDAAWFPSCRDLQQKIKREFDGSHYCQSPNSHQAVRVDMVSEIVVREIS